MLPADRSTLEARRVLLKGDCSGQGEMFEKSERQRTRGGRAARINRESLVGAHKLTGPTPSALDCVVLKIRLLLAYWIVARGCCRYSEMDVARVGDEGELGDTGARSEMNADDRGHERDGVGGDDEIGAGRA